MKATSAAKNGRGLKVPKAAAPPALVSEGAAVEAAWRAWFTPPPSTGESVRDQRLLDAATQFTIGFRGLALNSYTWGSGPTVLLMHGWGGRASQFAAFVPRLVDAGLRPVAVDAPAHGRTGGEQTNLFEFAAVVERVAAREQPIHAIIAHSMGGASATIAIGRGIHVNRVVLVAPICRLRDALSRFTRRRKLGEVVEMDFVARMEEKFGPDVWEDSALDRIAPRLVTPALLIHDRDDAEIPYDDSVRTSRAWPKSSLITTKGLGHRSLLRDSGLVSQAIEFVTS